jgi:hypothetical protein
MKILIATPVRAACREGALVTVGYSERIRQMLAEFPSEIIPHVVTYGLDNVRARNYLASFALHEMQDWSHILWWDDDQWPDDVRCVQAMIATGEELIGAPYTRKIEPVKWVHQEFDRLPQAGMVRSVRFLGFGFTLTSRACIQKMYDASVKYRGDATREYQMGDMFDLQYDEDHGEKIKLSEDFSFCKKWREMGGRACLYLGALVYHAGVRAYSARDIKGALE